MDEFWIEIRKGHPIVETPGVDLGGRVHLVHHAGRYAVLRIPAGKHWAGIGMDPEPHPSKWMLVKIARVTVSAKDALMGKAFSGNRATVIEQVEPGRRWREERHRMIWLCTKALCPCGGFIQDGAFVHAECCEREPKPDCRLWGKA
jgi:hypothetical protein